MYCTVGCSLICLLLMAGLISGREPQCSRFHYDEQLLEKMIRTEIKVEKMRKDVKTSEENVHTKLETIDTKMLEFESDFKQLKSELTEKVADQLSSRPSLTDATDKSICAFNAYGINDVNLAQNQVIVFTNTLFNIGDVYNSGTGRFTAPVDGIYMFSTYICIKTNRWFYFAIMKNDENVFVGSQHDKTYKSCASATVTVMLQANDEVGVKCTETAADVLVHDQYRRHTFSGALIHAYKR